MRRDQLLNLDQAHDLSARESDSHRPFKVELAPDTLELHADDLAAAFVGVEERVALGRCFIRNATAFFGP